MPHELGVISMRSPALPRRKGHRRPRSGRPVPQGPGSCGVGDRRRWARPHHPSRLCRRLADECEPVARLRPKSWCLPRYDPDPRPRRWRARSSRRESPV